MLVYAFMPTRVLLVDDHTMFREGLKVILERAGFVIVGEATDGLEAIKLAKQCRPSVVVMDLSMPVMNGIDAASQIRQDTQIQTVLLTMRCEEHYILRAFSAGIFGYVLKSRAASDLIQAIQEVVRGNLYLSPGISNTIVREMLNKDPNQKTDELTLRERQVLQLIAEGKSTKEISALMEISVRTGESHRARLMEKLNIHDIAGLVRYAIRQGFVQV
jgi:two-component system response regulator NreC